MNVYSYQHNNHGNESVYNLLTIINLLRSYIVVASLKSHIRNGLKITYDFNDYDVYDIFMINIIFEMIGQRRTILNWFNAKLHSHVKTKSKNILISSLGVIVGVKLLFSLLFCH